MITADSPLTADSTLPADGLLLVATPGYTLRPSRIWRIVLAARSWLVAA